MLSKLKSLLPDHPVKCPILFGPLRGARPLMNPRSSLRYIFGLYEHELNGWLRETIPTVNALFDVGANHGYFCLGVLAAWKRQSIAGQAWAFEPQTEEVRRIETALSWHGGLADRLTIQQGFVSDEDSHLSVTLDRYVADHNIPVESLRSMIKIDVEGAEMKVLEGASRLVRPANRFLIEVHSASLLEETLEFFGRQNHPVRVIHQKPLPIIGREQRDIENYWVVSI